MKKLEITVPEGKIAEWVNGVLTLVNEKDMEQKMKYNQNRERLHGKKY